MAQQQQQQQQLGLTVQQQTASQLAQRMQHLLADESLDCRVTVGIALRSMGAAEQAFMLGLSDEELKQTLLQLGPAPEMDVGPAKSIEKFKERFNKLVLGRVADSLLMWGDQAVEAAEQQPAVLTKKVVQRLLVPVSLCLLVSTSLGGLCYWVAHMLGTHMLGIGFGMGCAIFFCLRLGHWGLELAALRRQPQHQQQKQELLDQMAALPCAWIGQLFVWGLFWLLVLLSGLLAITFGQLWHVWTLPQPRKPRDPPQFWLKACVTLELVVWGLAVYICVYIWSDVSEIGASHSWSSKSALSTCVAAFVAALRGSCKLLFDVEDKLKATLWGWASLHHAFGLCSAVADLAFFFLDCLLAGLLGGGGLFALLKFNQLPWAVAVCPRQPPRQMQA